jgi:hypothetical protein
MRKPRARACHRQTLSAALALGLAAAAYAGDPRVPGGEGRFHDTPDAGASGGITAPVTPIKNLEEALVIEPTTFRVYRADINRGDGRIAITGLPPGKYSLLLKFHSTVVEGIELDVPGGFQKLSPEDWKYLQWETWRSNDFFNHKRIARAAGNRKRVKMLVEQVRDKKTFEPSGRVMKGLLIRRLELTDMRKTGEVWQIKKVRHLYREERKMDAPGRTLDFVYSPKLGGIRVGDDVVELPLIEARQLGVPLPDHFYTAHQSLREGHFRGKAPQ